MSLSDFDAATANMSCVVQPMTYAAPLRYFLVLLYEMFLECTLLRLLLEQLWLMTMIAVVPQGGVSWLLRHRIDFVAWICPLEVTA